MLASLPDDVRELVISVQARARQSPKEQDIRALAAEKASQAGHGPVPVAQISALADVAIGLTAEIADTLAELAELTGSGHGRA
jgi:hypothetical protein